MAIDLGTANTIVSVKGKGIIINEPSVVAVQHDRYGRDRILAVGKEAKQMIGKTPVNIQAVRPMKDGVIADFEMTERMIRYFIEKAHGRKSFLRPRIIICIPHGITQVERKAVRESALSAGAREVYLVEEPMAAAIGAGIPVSSPNGYVVVDIGGGTTEIGVTSLGGLVLKRTAENIKLDIGTAIKQTKDTTIKVKGRDSSGLLTTIELTSEGVRTALHEPLKEISLAVRQVLEEMPPDLAGDVVDNGVVLTGGGALIRGLDKYLANDIKLPVRVAEDPLLAVAYGTSKTLDEESLLRLISNE
ncbi:Cell shape-determining protein MreB [Aduncisulcus paluster]|uniref:Cell shape-determining protein MreB n=1 Tax=Aduncisulcus paluster TaxID=2918883 RepID=A0ABQ5KJ85_9EUKA|nr:Cell shape-determining protein MreB [Aduncisulcus paluster]